MNCAGGHAAQSLPPKVRHLTERKKGGNNGNKLFGFGLPIVYPCMRQSQSETAPRAGQVPDPSTLTGASPVVLVLVADDDEAQRRLATLLLELAGCCVVPAHTGHEAVNHAASCRYDLILMNLQLPMLDGFAATAAIRSGERRFGSAPVPIVALSALGGDNIRRRCLLAGINDHFVKPLSQRRLAEILAKAARQPSLTRGFA